MNWQTLKSLTNNFQKRCGEQGTLMHFWEIFDNMQYNLRWSNPVIQEFPLLLLTESHICAQIVTDILISIFYNRKIVENNMCQSPEQIKIFWYIHILCKILCRRQRVSCIYVKNKEQKIQVAGLCMYTDTCIRFQIYK